jgi:hypothetical protein
MATIISISLRRRAGTLGWNAAKRFQGSLDVLKALRKSDACSIELTVLTTASDSTS